MKLSEAMMLGDSLRTRDESVFLVTRADGTSCGCAIGGATLAVGGSILDHETLWPWLEDLIPNSYGLRWVAAIGCDPDLGFKAVMAGSITFEQLVDYVASVEPSCGDCNRFDCTCVKSEAAPEANIEVLA